MSDKLIDRAAFMIVTLEELEGQIAANGVVSEYQNGENQWGTKKSPEVEVYNTIVKNFISITDQLCKLLPKDEAYSPANEIAAFLVEASGRRR